MSTECGLECSMQMDADTTWRWNVSESICDTVHHYQFEVCPSLVERFPSKVGDHLTGAAGGCIVDRLYSPLS